MVFKNRHSPLSTLTACLGFVLVQIAFFHDNLFGGAYTGWDTHDWIFVNFLYFSDAIRDSGVPFWNHFIQSGNYLPSFNNAGLYTLFYAPFVAASWVMNTMRSFELMIQAVILIGSIGAYLFFKIRGIGRGVAFLGAVLYSLALLMPITGQLAFVFSFAALPWMLMVATEVVTEKHRRKNGIGMAKSLILPVSLPLFIASGYVWLNFVNFAITFFWGICLIYIEHKGSKPDARGKLVFKLVVVLALIGFLYLMFIGPGLMNLLNYYSIFDGDFISPEPRMRGLSPVQNYSYSSMMSAIMGIVDPRLAVTRPAVFLDIKLTWSYGVGLVAFLLAFLLPGSLKKVYKYWWFVFVVFFLYSIGNSYGIDRVIRRLPVLNANRWWFVGAYYCSISLIMIAIFKLDEYFKSDEKINFRARVLICLVVVVFFAANTVGYFRYLSAGGGALILLLFYFKRQYKTLALIFLLVFCVLESATLRGTGESYKFASVPDAEDYYRLVDARSTSVTITKNSRKLSTEKDYVFYDVDWFLNKVPIAHGYNHIGNPLYWFLKNDNSISKIVFISDGLRLKKDIFRANMKNDNVFAEELASDVLKNPLAPIVSADVFNACNNSNVYNGSIQSIVVDPNSATIAVENSGPVFVVFNNVYYRGWRASVDGREVPIDIANRIFMGVCVVGSGVHTINFSFYPLGDILLLSAPNLLLLILLLFIAFHKLTDILVSAHKKSVKNELLKSL